jgi:hypothetical protein
MGHGARSLPATAPPRSPGSLGAVIAPGAGPCHYGYAPGLTTFVVERTLKVSYLARGVAPCGI